MSTSNSSIKSALRKQLRKDRQSISSVQRRRFDDQICRRLAQLPVFQSAKRVGIYLAFDGEPSLQVLVNHFPRKLFYIPVIRRERMSFVNYAPELRLRKNTYGISEPLKKSKTPSSAINLVLTPLVGFDKRGNRLGMGGGFYDRHFAQHRSREYFFNPRLLGVAYELQNTTSLPTENWDIPLQGVVTNHTIHIFKRQVIE